MIAFISDIHGNLAALDAVLARIDALGIDQIACLGDTAGYYPHVNECCAILADRGIPSVRGNHDHYLATGTRSGRSEHADACIDYLETVVGDDTMAWLAALPERAEFGGVSTVHGGWNDPIDEYLLHPDDDYFAGLDGRYFASGHTHTATVWTGDQAVYCNPGSVGQPRDGDPRAAFACFDGERFRIERVPYDIGRTREAVAAAGLPDIVAANLDRGLAIGVP